MSAAVNYGSLRVSDASKCLSHQRVFARMFPCLWNIVPAVQHLMQTHSLSVCTSSSSSSSVWQSSNVLPSLWTMCGCSCEFICVCVWLRQYINRFIINSPECLLTPAWVQQARRRPPIQTRHFSSEERLVPLWIQQTGDLAKDWRKKGRAAAPPKQIKLLIRRAEWAVSSGKKANHWIS